jgi:TRAP-type C4-dicarboxylate transport system substrate-binding protein
MRSIDNPVRVFNYVSELSSDKFMLNLLMLKTKYDAMPEEDKKAIEKLQKEKTDLQMKDIKIKSPNNPAQLLDAKLITFLV